MVDQPAEDRVDVVPGLCSITFRDLEPAAVVDLAADAGLEAIEWGADGHVPVGAESTAESVAALSADAGLRCPSYGSYLGMDPSKGEPAEACDTAVALGATNIRVWARFGIDHTASEEERAEVTREVSGFADEAASRGLTVGIECHGWTLTDTAESTRRLVADVDAEHVYSYWQPNYWDPEVNRSPERQIDELDHMAADLSNLHVYWWHGMDRLALQEGADTWVPALALARRAGRWGGERFAFLEYVAGDDPGLLAREAATLRGWIDEGSPGTRQIANAPAHQGAPRA